MPVWSWSISHTPSDSGCVLHFSKCTGYDPRMRHLATIRLVREAAGNSPGSPPRRKKIRGPPTDAGATNFVRSTQAHSGLTVSRISATSSTDRAVVDPVSLPIGCVMIQSLPRAADCYASTFVDQFIACRTAGLSAHATLNMLPSHRRYRENTARPEAMQLFSGHTGRKSDFRVLPPTEEELPEAVPMLAEIFLLRWEMLARASDEAQRVNWFVP